MSEILDICITQEGVNATDRILLQCALSELQKNGKKVGSTETTNDDIRSILLLFSGFSVFFMQAGFAMVCAGLVRKKNLHNTMLKNLLDACCASIAFFAVGYAFAFGNTDPTSPQKTFTGTGNFFLMDVHDLSFWMFQYAFSAASATIVAGSLAERCTMKSYLGYSIVLTAWVYPIVAHAIWDRQGFLSANSVAPLWDVGMIDFAGSSVVHVTGGLTALLATIFIGPRRGRFHDDRGRLLDSPRPIKGFSPALQMLGTLVLWFAWYSFCCGSALFVELNDSTAKISGLAATTTTIAAGSSALTALIFNAYLLDRKTPGDGFLDIQFAMNGCLSGLVTINAGCALFEPWAALLVGICAGLIYVGGNRFLLRFKIDDVVDAVPVHLFSGVWGVISVGLFSSPSKQQLVYHRSVHYGLFYSWGNGVFDATLLGIQILGVLLITCWVCIFIIPFSYFLDYNEILRCDPFEELAGLDAHEKCVLDGASESKAAPPSIVEDDSLLSPDNMVETYKTRRQLKNAELIRERTMYGGSAASSSIKSDRLRNNIDETSVSKRNDNI